MLQKPATLLEVFDRVKGQKFRVRRTSDLTDHLVMGTTKYSGMGFPERFSVLNLQTGNFHDTDGANYGFVLLSSPDEVKEMRSMGEHNVLPVIRSSYGLPTGRY